VKLRRGSVCVSITPCTVKVAGQPYQYHRLRYHQDGRLHRPIFKTLAAARQAAEAKLTELNQGRDAASKLTPADAASLARARQILSEHQLDNAIEVVAAEYAAACRKLPRDCTLSQAAEHYARTHPDTEAIPFPKLVARFLEFKAGDGTRTRYQAELKFRLELMARHITVPLLSLESHHLAAKLDELQRKHEWTNRSRNHYRAALSNLATFARQKNHLPRHWNEIKYVPKLKEQDGRVIIWTPAEAARIFDTAEAKMPKIVPALVAMFFMGHRQSEATGTAADAVPPLDWSDLDLPRGEGFLETGKVRTAGNRITHIPPNARQWLRLYARERGPLCPYVNLTNHLARLARLAGVEWKHNAARRSYISYRLAITRNLPRVSEETGTSVVTLQKRYRRPIALTEARKYFNILPAAELRGKLLPALSQKRAKNGGPCRSETRETMAAKG